MNKTKTASKKEATPKKSAAKKTAEPKKKASKTQANVTAEAEKKLLETEVVVVLVLDRSGSMDSIAEATVTGYNSFLKEQKLAEGKGFLTLIQFADNYQVDCKSLPIEEAQELVLNKTYLPTGSATALRDAIGKTINDIKTDRDVIFVIITDGQENRSVEYTQAAVKKMIETMESEHKWKFIYLGANQDAFTIGQTYGVKGANSMTYSADNAHVGVAFMNVSNNLSAMRSSKASYLSKMQVDTTVTYSTATMDMMEKDLSFSDDQRVSSVK